MLDLLVCCFGVPLFGWFVGLLVGCDVALLCWRVAVWVCRCLVVLWVRCVALSLCCFAVLYGCWL